MVSCTIYLCHYVIISLYFLRTALYNNAHSWTSYSGDGRCDSPGKFCTYTLMETSENVILHSETVDKREVHNKSPNMECEAVHRALGYLQGKVNLVEVTTDS